MTDVKFPGTSEALRLRTNRQAIASARRSGYGNVAYRVIGSDGRHHTHRTPSNFLNYHEVGFIPHSGDPIRVHSHFNTRAKAIAYFMFHDKDGDELILIVTFEATRWYPAVNPLTAEQLGEFLMAWGQRLHMHCFRFEPYSAPGNVENPSFGMRDVNRSNMNWNGLKLIPRLIKVGEDVKRAYVLGWTH